MGESRRSSLVTSIMSGLLVFSVLPLLTALVWLRMREPDWRGALIQANVA